MLTVVYEPARTRKAAPATTPPASVQIQILRKSPSYMQGGEADVVPEQEEAVAQVDGKAQVFGGGPNSASAIAMLLSSRTVLCGALQLRLCTCVDRPWLNRYYFSSAPLDLWVSASNVYSPVLQLLVMPLLSDLANTA